jgi:hypothetical protein
MKLADSATAKLSTTIRTTILCQCKPVDFYHKNIREHYIAIHLNNKENEDLWNVFNTTFIYIVLSSRKKIHIIIPVKVYKKNIKKKPNGIWYNKTLSRRHFYLNDTRQNNVINKKILDRNEWYIFHISVIFRNDYYQLARIWPPLSRTKVSRNQSRMLTRKLCSASTNCLQYTRLLLYQTVFFSQSVTWIVITIKLICIEYIAGLHNIALTSQCALRDILH